MDRRRAAGALLALAACIACSAAAPTASDHTALDMYEGAKEGCYYNFQHYGEGDRIMTNEPCLNCTCHNRMLMCYLRVCPFTKPIGQDCTVEKRADQCCPIVTCPDVPVDLLTSTSTSSPAEYGATGLGKLDKYGCSINGKYFPEGSKVPPTPNKPCEHCYCIRNMTTCVMQECTLHVDGCTPIYHKDVCCPVRYSCDHPEDEVPLLDDMSTTVRPTPGFLLTTTTLSSVTQMSQDCVHNDQIIADGASISTEKACEHCYCMKGDIVCVVQECGAPMENEGKNCTSLPPREGQCCPDTYICEGDEPGTDVPSEYATDSLLEKLSTLSPPRRPSIEGSGYRNEPDELAHTSAPNIDSDLEGSGEEQESTHSSFEPFSPEKPLVPEEITPAFEEYIPVTTEVPRVEKIETSTKDVDRIISGDNIDSETDEPPKYIQPTKQDDDKLTDITDEPPKYIQPTKQDDDKLTKITDEPPKYIQPIKQDDDKLTEITDANIKLDEPGITITTPVSDSLQKITTEPGEYLNTVPDIVPDVEYQEPHKYSPITTDAPSIDENLTTGPKDSEKPIDTSLNEDQYSTSNPSLQSIPESERTTLTPQISDDIDRATTEKINILPDLETEKETVMPETSLDTSTSAPVIEEKETVAPQIVEDSKPEQYDTSSTIIPVKEIKPSTELPDHEQNTIGFAEDHIGSSEEMKKVTTSDLENIVTEAATKADITETHEDVSSASPVLEDGDRTTIEPDKGLNTIPNETSDESSQSSLADRTTASVETKATESTIIFDSTERQEEDIKLSTDSASSKPLETHATRGDQYTITTEPSFRREDEASVSTERSKEESERTTTKSEFVDEGLIPTSTHEDDKNIVPNVSSMDEDITTVIPDYKEESVENVSSIEPITEAVPSVTQNIINTISGDQGETLSSTEKSEVPTTEYEQHEDSSRIPGEGDCLANSVTYKNNSAVPTSNKCHISCKCVSSIIKCDPIICSLPPDYMNNCQSIYDSPDSCCPTYICENPKETVPPKSDSQMSGTEAPVPPQTIECRGDQCELSEPVERPLEPEHDQKLTPGDCGALGCDTSKEPVSSPPSVAHPGCIDGQCETPVESCIHGECQSLPTPSEVPVIKPCEGENCKTTSDEILSPACENDEECKKTEVTLPQATDSQQQPCNEESGCKPQEIISPDCSGDEPCRRKDTPIAEELPSKCVGNHCVQESNILTTEVSTIEDVPIKHVPVEEKPIQHIDSQILDHKDAETTTSGDHVVTDRDRQTEKTPIDNDIATEELILADIEGTKKPDHSDQEGIIKPIDEETSTITTKEEDIGKPIEDQKEGVMYKPDEIEDTHEDKIEAITRVPGLFEEGYTDIPETQKVDEPFDGIEPQPDKPTVEDTTRFTEHGKTTDKSILIQEETTKIYDTTGQYTGKPVSFEDKATSIPDDRVESTDLFIEKDTTTSTLTEDHSDKPIVIEEQFSKKPDITTEEKTSEPTLSYDSPSTSTDSLSSKKDTVLPVTESIEKQTLKPTGFDEGVTNIYEIDDQKDSDKTLSIDKQTTDMPSLVGEENIKPDSVSEEVIKENTDKTILVDDASTRGPDTTVHDKPDLIVEDIKTPETEGERYTTTTGLIVEVKPEIVDTSSDEGELVKEKPILVEDELAEKPIVIKEEDKEKIHLDDKDSITQTVITEEGTEIPEVIDDGVTKKPIIIDESIESDTQFEDDKAIKISTTTEEMTTDKVSLDDDKIKDKPIVFIEDTQKPTMETETTITLDQKLVGTLVPETQTISSKLPVTEQHATPVISEIEGSGIGETETLTPKPDVEFELPVTSAYDQTESGDGRVTKKPVYAIQTPISEDSQTESSLGPIVEHLPEGTSESPDRKSPEATVTVTQESDVDKQPEISKPLSESEKETYQPTVDVTPDQNLLTITDKTTESMESVLFTNAITKSPELEGITMEQEIYMDLPEQESPVTKYPEVIPIEPQEGEHTDLPEINVISSGDKEIITEVITEHPIKQEIPEFFVTQTSPKYDATSALFEPEMDRVTVTSISTDEATHKIISQEPETGTISTQSPMDINEATDTSLPVTLEKESHEKPVSSMEDVSPEHQYTKVPDLSDQTYLKTSTTPPEIFIATGQASTEISQSHVTESTVPDDMKVTSEQSQETDTAVSVTKPSELDIEIPVKVPQEEHKLSTDYMTAVTEIDTKSPLVQVSTEVSPSLDIDHQHDTSVSIDSEKAEDHTPPLSSQTDTVSQEKITGTTIIESEVTTIKPFEESTKISVDTSTLEGLSETTPYLIELEEHTHKMDDTSIASTLEEEDHTDKFIDDTITPLPHKEDDKTDQETTISSTKLPSALEHEISKDASTSTPSIDTGKINEPEIDYESHKTSTVKVPEEKLEDIATVSQQPEISSESGDESSTLSGSLIQNTLSSYERTTVPTDILDKYEDHEKDVTTTKITADTDEIISTISTETEMSPIYEVKTEKESLSTEIPMHPDIHISSEKTTIAENVLTFVTSETTPIKEEEILSLIIDDKDHGHVEKPGSETGELDTPASENKYDESEKKPSSKTEGVIPPKDEQTKPDDKPIHEIEETTSSISGDEHDKLGEKPTTDTGEIGLPVTVDEFGHPEEKPSNKPEDITPISEDKYNKPDEKPVSEVEATVPSVFEDKDGKYGEKPTSEYGDIVTPISQDKYGVPEEKPTDEPTDNVPAITEDQYSKPDEKPASETEEPISLVSEDKDGIYGDKPTSETIEIVTPISEDKYIPSEQKPIEPEDTIPPVSEDKYSKPDEKPTTDSADLTASVTEDKYSKPDEKPISGTEDTESPVLVDEDNKYGEKPTSEIGEIVTSIPKDKHEQPEDKPSDEPEHIIPPKPEDKYSKPDEKPISGVEETALPVSEDEDKKHDESTESAEIAIPISEDKYGQSEKKPSSKPEDIMPPTSEDEFTKLSEKPISGTEDIPLSSEDKDDKHGETSPIETGGIIPIPEDKYDQPDEKPSSEIEVPIQSEDNYKPEEKPISETETTMPIISTDDGKYSEKPTEEIMTSAPEDKYVQPEETPGSEGEHIKPPVSVDDYSKPDEKPTSGTEDISFVPEDKDGYGEKPTTETVAITTLVSEDNSQSQEKPSSAPEDSMSLISGDESDKPDEKPISETEVPVPTVSDDKDVKYSEEPIKEIGETVTPISEDKDDQREEKPSGESDVTTSPVSEDKYTKPDEKPISGTEEPMSTISEDKDEKYGEKPTSETSYIVTPESENQYIQPEKKPGGETEGTTAALPEDEDTKPDEKPVSTTEHTASPITGDKEDKDGEKPTSETGETLTPVPDDKYGQSEEKPGEPEDNIPLVPEDKYSKPEEIPISETEEAMSPISDDKDNKYDDKPTSDIGEIVTPVPEDKYTQPEQEPTGDHEDIVPVISEDKYSKPDEKPTSEPEEIMPPVSEDKDSKHGEKPTDETGKIVTPAHDDKYGQPEKKPMGETEGTMLPPSEDIKPDEKPVSGTEAIESPVSVDEDDKYGKKPTGEIGEIVTPVPEDKHDQLEEKPSDKPEHILPPVPEDKYSKPDEKPTIGTGETAQPVFEDKDSKDGEKPASETEEIVPPPTEDVKPDEKPSIETVPPSATSDIPKPISETHPIDDIPVPEDDTHFPPSGTYGEPDYVEEDQAFGPGTCRYGGKVYVSAQQIPRDDPCDFCFCFRSDIICLQQSCPPPIHGCHEEPIRGFCCPRYECPVSMATTVNVTTTTTTTTTTLPPHFPTHSYKGAAQRRGCQIKGHSYKVGEVVRSSSGPCLHCTCGGDGQMKCDPKACTPEPMLRQMIAAAVSAKRRR